MTVTLTLLFDLEGPSNCVVPVKVTGTASAGFEVEYTPTEAGRFIVTTTKTNCVFYNKSREYNIICDLF